MPRFFLIAGLGLLALVIIGLLALLYLGNELRKLTVPPPLSVDANAPIAPQLDPWFADLHEREQFNGVVSLRSGGQVVYRNAVGSTDETGATPLLQTTPMRLASLSKPFTATAVLGLASAGRIDLDAPLSTYWPDCGLGPVTPRHLLSHTSGLPDDYMSLSDSSTIITNADVRRHVCREDRAQANPPGATYAYNNTGYVLLAALVERVTGETFEDHLRDAVLAPLGMETSRVFNRVSPEGGLPVAPTFLQWERPPEAQPPGNIDGVSGDGSVHSSLLDLERFAQAWIDGTILPADMADAALTPGLGDYGLGWVIDADADADADFWVWHNGRWLGASSYLGFDRNSGDWIILVDNGGSLAVDAIAGQLRKVLAADR